MMFPKIQSRCTERMEINALRGGCNLRDGERQTADTQLAEVRNMWWQNGALRTRPAFQAIGMMRKSYTNQSVSYQFIEGKLAYTDVSSRWVLERVYNYTTRTVSLYSGMIGDDGYFVTYGGIDGLPADTEAFAIAHSYGEAERVLIYVSNGKVYAQNEQSGTWRDLSDEVYCPCVLQNGEGHRAASYRWPVLPTPNAQGRNLLGDAFCARYTTTAADYRYFLPYDELDDTKPVEISLTDENGWTFTYTVEAGVAYSAVDSRGVKALVDRAEGMVRFVYDGTNEALVMPQGAENNLEIRASKARTDEEKQLVARMRFCALFGGQRQGAAKRFMAGTAAYPSRMYWCEADMPLYISESDYVTVGNQTGSVTAFGQQDGKLMVFKERELYCLTDVAAWQSTDKPYEIPLVQIHDKIGTMSPQTVCLCGNCLCWADGIGGVYALVSATGGYAVRPLSAMVQPALSAHNFQYWKTAVAAVYRGYYILVVQQKAYALRIDEKAFRRYESVYADLTTQQGLAWFVWDLPANQTALYFEGEGKWAVLLMKCIDGSVTKVTTVTLQETDQDFTVKGSNSSIEVMLRTKWYDMGDAITSKCVTRVHLDMQTRGNARVLASYHYDGVELFVWKDYAYISSTLQLKPPLSNVKRFGFTLRSTGQIVVENAAIVYRRMKT